MTETGQQGRQVWVLMAHDPTTGLATQPVGAAGTDGGQTVISWLPLSYVARAAWTARLAADGDDAGLRGAIAAVNGITLGALEVDPPPSLDVRGSVEAVADDLVAFDRGGWDG